MSRGAPRWNHAEWITLANKSWIKEAPWVVGVLLGLIGLWWRGYAFVPLPFISSYDWMEYVPSAYMVTHGVDLGGYATWRNPLYPAILGHTGEWIGYNEAAWLIASISMSLVVFASGLGGRALSNPWAGFVAAITIPLINPWAEASRWATLYPMLTAATAMTLGCGAAFMRWHRPGLGILAATFAGLGLGIDFRGIALVAAVAAFAVFVWAQNRKTVAAIVVLVPLLAAPLINQTLAISHQKETATAVYTQRALEVSLALESGNPALVQACQNEPIDSAYPTPAALLRPCAWAFVTDNIDRLTDQTPFGVGPTLWLLPLVLLGGGRGWRGSLQSLLVFGAGFGAMFLMAVWARLNVHHFVQFAAPIAMVVPVALMRTVDCVLPSTLRRPTSILVGLGAAWIAFNHGPWAGKPVDDMATAEQHQLLGWMLDGVEMHFDEKNGDVLLDCTGLGVEAALLPRKLHSGHPNFQPSALSARCQAWIHTPPEVNGRVWLITRAEPGFAGPPRPPWFLVQAWEDGPRQTWLWMVVDSPSDQP
jgi:hypothetical protein